MAHIVNLIVHDGTKEANVCINRVRQAVRYIRQSPARWKKFQKCCENENLAKKSSCLDVPTRWNSTYMILNRVIDYEGAIVEYADPDIDLALHLKFVDIVDKNSTFGVYLNLLISNEDHVLAKMAENMKEKFDKYWGDTEKMNKMVFIPCVLDPRHKFSTLGFALKKMLGEKGAVVKIDFIMPRLHGSNARSHVWNHYEKLKEKEDGSWTVKCVHCGRVTYHHSHKTGTASLRKHVKHCLENRNQNRQLLRIDD
ncbi:hypothetical protein KY289_036622 [Solanum tuberosum]|nr:hypothetical protein KY284_036448 [Solanum tuberosum]KAH0636707.1 hypothetical protein KY289_036622 [Solanum tuberosum]